MLKFFRRIRRKLIDEGNLKRYLAYSIGEILLVVFGILIALAINNWWQDRQNARIEREYLSALKEDIQTDIQNIEKYKIRAYERVQKPLERAINTFLENDPNSVDTIQLLNDIQMSMFMNILLLRNGTYEDLKSTGNLKLISNSTIRSELHDYFEKAKFYDFYYKGFLNGKLHVGDVLEESYPFRYNNKSEGLLNKFDPLDKPVNIENILSNTRLENVLYKEHFITKWMDNSFNDMVEKAKEIEGLLLEELEK